MLKKNIKKMRGCVILENMFRANSAVQDGDLEIQQNSQPDSKTYFFSMRPRRSELSKVDQNDQVLMQ